MRIDSPVPFPEFPWPPLQVDFPAAANWVRFVDPGTADGDLLPPSVLPRPAGGTEVVRQWRAWQGALVSGQCPMAEPQVLVGDEPSTDVPSFDGLDPWPELRAHCRDSWYAFQRWRIAWFHRLSRINAGVPGREVARVVASMAPGQAARIEVIALAEPVVLRERAGEATVTLGFLASDRYLPWLRGFTAGAPIRDRPPDWCPPPPRPPVPGDRVDSGGHGVSTSSGTFANWFAFACPELGRADFHEPPEGRPDPEDQLIQQWWGWWESAPRRTGPRPDAERRLMELHGAAPGFDAVGPWPELRAYLRAAWPGFRAWLPRAQRRGEDAARAAGRAVSDLRALDPRWSKRTRRQDTIEVVAVRAARVLVQEPGYAVVTAGLVESAGFADWVLDFTADREAE